MPTPAPKIKSASMWQPPAAPSRQPALDAALMTAGGEATPPSAFLRHRYLLHLLFSHSKIHDPKADANTPKKRKAGSVFRKKLPYAFCRRTWPFPFPISKAVNAG